MSSLHKDMAEIMGIVGYIQKDSKNDFHGYKYASAEKVLSKVNEEVSKRGICLSTQAELIKHESGHAVVKVTLVFIRGEEPHILMQGIGEGADKGDKAVMKANTAAIKYALAGGFLISWGNDPEADVSVDKSANTATDWLGTITGTKTMDELKALVPKLQSLTTTGKITPGHAKKLRAAYEKQEKALAA